MKNLSDLGDKNNVALCFADAATAVITNKTEPSYAGRTHILMTARSIRHPFQSIGTHRTTIVHLSKTLISPVKHKQVIEININSNVIRNLCYADSAIC